MNILVDFVYGPSFDISHVSIPITQEYLETMFAIHEGQVKKYVENSIVDVRDGISSAISTSSKNLIKGQEVLKMKYDL